MRALILLALVLVVVLACAPSSEPSPAVSQSLVAKKDTVVEDLQDYKSWHLATLTPVAMSPAVSELCMAKVPSHTLRHPPNPHMPSYFQVYVNPIGKEAFLDKSKPFPVGTMILKEKLAGSSKVGLDELVKQTPELVTAMVKRVPGFDPDNGDWQYVVLLGDASKATTEGLKHCAACHASRKSQRFVFADYPIQ